MTTLAYDPERLQALARRMAAALDELHRLTSTDPLAAPLANTAHRAARALEAQWLPVVRRLLTADPLAVRGDGTDLADAEVVRLDADGVRSLAAMLDTVGLDELRDDPQQWDLLASMLQLIDRHPALRRLLLEQVHDWPRLTDALAREYRWRAADGDHRAMARLDALFARLAAEFSDDLSALDTMQPYTASLLVQHLRLDAAELAEVTDRLVLRWCDEPWTDASVGSASEFADGTQPNPADVLFPLLVARPDAAQRYVALAALHPRTVLAATSHPDLAHRVVLVATDPSHVDPATAGHLLVPLLDWYRSDQAPSGTAVHDPDWSLFLAEAVAPWTRQLGPLNHDWGLTADHQRALVQLLVRDDATLDELVRRADTIRASLLARPGDAAPLDEFAAYLAMLQQVVVNRRVDDEERVHAGWSLLVSIAGAAGGLLPGGPLASVAGSAAVNGLGLLDPSDVERARHDAEYGKELTLTTAAASVADAVYWQWLDAGSLPASIPRPPGVERSAHHPALQFRDEFAGWLSLLPGGADGELADHVDRLVSTLMNAADAGAAVAR